MLGADVTIEAASRSSQLQQGRAGPRELRERVAWSRGTSVTAIFGIPPRYAARPAPHAASTPALEVHTRLAGPMEWDRLTYNYKRPRQFSKQLKTLFPSHGSVNIDR